MRSWFVSSITVILFAGCAKESPLEISGKVRFFDSNEPLKGAEVHLLVIGSQLPPDMPMIETSSVTFSDENGDYKFLTGQDGAYMVQLIPSECRYLGDRMPVHIKYAERTGKLRKVVVNLNTGIDRC